MTTQTNLTVVVEDLTEAAIRAALLAGVISDRLAEDALAALRGCFEAERNYEILELVAELMCTAEV